MNNDTVGDETSNGYQAEDPFTGMFNQVMASVKANLGVDGRKTGQSTYELFMGFVHAVDWSESWIQSLLAGEVMLLIAVLLTRKRMGVQCTIFMATRT